MRISDNSSKVIPSFSRGLVKVAVPAAYLLSVGLLFTAALRVGMALVEL